MIPLLLVIGAAAAVFWRTAYPTITWWDSSSYSLAAATLGLTSPPGSLLLTLLGWVVTRFPSSSPAYQLNLFAGVLAAVTVGVVFLVALRALRLFSETSSDDRRATAIGAALGALAFAFSTTLWEHAVKFTPYVLTAVFTAVILWTMVRWWEDADHPNAWRWLALLGLLFGLDFSVHRTNALLIPGVLAWVLIRHPRTVGRKESWLGGAAGLAIGLSLQLLVMPIAAHTGSSLNMFEPSDWPRFWDYVSLANTGGGFLVDLWPRKAAFLSVQVADFIRALGDNYFQGTTSVPILGWLPALAAVVGLVALWRRERRLGAAFTAVLLLQASMTVLYFNIPAGFFRSLDRHYLPVLVTIAVLVACGAGVAARQLGRWLRKWTGSAAAATVVAVVAVALAPAAQLAGNWAKHDASGSYFTRDFAANALETLPPDAIFFTVGDNDTFPPWYLQAVEGVRPDVTIVNLSLANTSWYVDQLMRQDPSFPISLPNTGAASPDSTVVIPVGRTAEQLGLPAGTVVPDSITVRPRPRFGTEFLAADSVLLNIVRTNAWRRPLCFSATAGGMGWLEPYGRLEGLRWCIVPVLGLGVNRDLLRANLFTRHEYRGYADRSVYVDDISRTFGSLYLHLLGLLLEADRAHGTADRCRNDITRLFAALPPDRVGLSAKDREGIEAHCQG